MCRNSYQLQLLWDGSTTLRSQPCLFLLCDHVYKHPPVSSKSEVVSTL